MTNANMLFFGVKNYILQMALSDIFVTVALFDISGKVSNSMSCRFPHRQKTGDEVDSPFSCHLIIGLITTNTKK